MSEQLERTKQQDTYDPDMLCSVLLIPFQILLNKNSMTPYQFLETYCLNRPTWWRIVIFVCMYFVCGDMKYQEDRFSGELHFLFASCSIAQL